MSTNSLIAIENNDLSVESVYCHWDGYLAYNGTILQNNYLNMPKLRELIAGGNMSVLKPTISECEFYGDEPAEKFASIREFMDTVTKTDGYRGIEFVYIYTNGSWMVVDVDAKTVLPLSYALSTMKENYTC